MELAMAEVKVESRQVALHSTILCTLLLIVCTAIFIDAMRLPEPKFEPLGAALVPQALCMIVGVLALAQLMKSIPVLLQSKGEKESRPTGQIYAISTLVCSIVYVTMMTFGIPFRWSTFFYLICLGAILTRFNMRKIGIMSVVAFVMAFGLHYLLIELFYVNLP